MNYKIEDEIYDVVIDKKNNKNTYIRVKDDMKIYVSTNHFVTKNQIEKLLNDNYDFLIKMLDKKKLSNEKKDKFFYLGQVYDIITISNKDIELFENKIYVKSIEYLNKWYKKETIRLFKERLDIIYNLFEENIPYPDLKIRKMKTRWGVCNKKTKAITLNSELMKYEIDKLDYVIIHELSHFIYFDHSSNFWKQVEKYCPCYKKMRKDLKD